MPESNRPLVERIARVLAGAAHSSNAEGSDPSAGDKVDRRREDAGPSLPGRPAREGHLRKGLSCAVVRADPVVGIRGGMLQVVS